MEKQLLKLLCLLQASLLCQGACPKFNFETTDVYAFTGSVVKYTMSACLCAGTTVPLNMRLKLAFNTSAVMRIVPRDSKDLPYRVNLLMNKTALTFTGSDAISITSSKNDDVMDEANVDLQMATASSDTCVKFSCLAQLVYTPSNKEKVWVSAGVEFINGSIWVSQLALIMYIPFNPHPNLVILTSIVELADKNVIIGTSFILTVKLRHNYRTSDGVATDVHVRLSIPKYLSYGGHSNNVQRINSNAHKIVIIKVGTIDIKDAVKFNVTFNIDANQVSAEEIHQGGVLIHETCCKKNKKWHQINFKYLIPGSCKSPLLATLPDDKFFASSYATADGHPKFAKMTHANNAWIAHEQGCANTFLVKFDSLKKVTRIEVRGFGNETTGGHVTCMNVYFSEDCGIWKQVKFGSKLKCLRANRDNKNIAVVSLKKGVVGKCFAIKPTKWKRQIQMKVEMYGCDAGALPSGHVELSTRNLLYVPSNSHLYACFLPFDRNPMDKPCVLSTDDGSSFRRFWDHRVKNIIFALPSESLLYGVGEKGSRYECPSDGMSLCSPISSTEFDAANAKSGKIPGKQLGHLSYITTDHTPHGDDQLNGMYGG